MVVRGARPKSYPITPDRICATCPHHAYFNVRVSTSPSLLIPIILIILLTQHPSHFHLHPFIEINMFIDPQFLIRSATTLLSIIDQQVEQPPLSSYERSVRFLHRIALLFVVKPEGDVSAFLAVLSGNGSILVACTDSIDATFVPNPTPEIPEICLVAKNSLKVTNPAATKHVRAGNAGSIGGNDRIDTPSIARPPMYFRPHCDSISLQDFD